LGKQHPAVFMRCPDQGGAVMPEIMGGFEGRVTNVFRKISCVAFKLNSGAMVVDGSKLLFEREPFFEHRQTTRSVEIDHRPVQIVVAGEKCAVLIDDRCYELPPNNTGVFLVNGPQATVGGKGTVFKVLHEKNVICVDLTEGALCKGDWIIINGEDGYRHEQIATSIEVGCTPQQAVLEGKKLGVLLEVDPEIGLPAEGDTVTVVSIKKQ